MHVCYISLGGTTRFN